MLKELQKVVDLLEAKLENEAILGLKNESTLRDGLSRACKISGVQSQGFHLTQGKI